jgi:hypothetical protein
MTPEQYIKGMDKTINDLTNQYNGVLMANVGMTALTLLRARVQETGVDAKGAKYKPYSTKAMLVGCKGMNASVCNSFFGKQKNKELDWVTINGRHLAVMKGGYKQFRELHGRQTDHVDFSFSNRMWDNINVISKQSEHQQGTAIIGARSDEERKKLEGNTKRRGDILDLSATEQEELKRIYNLDVLNVFRNNGL